MLTCIRFTIAICHLKLMLLSGSSNSSAGFLSRGGVIKSVILTQQQQQQQHMVWSRISVPFLHQFCFG